MPVTHSSSLDKLLDLVPDLIEKTTKMIENKLKNTEKIVKDNVIVRVSDMSDKNNSEENDNQKNTSNDKNKELSNTAEKDSKPYDVEYDETDM